MLQIRTLPRIIATDGLGPMKLENELLPKCAMQDAPFGMFHLKCVAFGFLAFVHTQIINSPSVIKIYVCDYAHELLFTSCEGVMKWFNTRFNALFRHVRLFWFLFCLLHSVHGWIFYFRDCWRCCCCYHHHLHHHQFIANFRFVSENKFAWTFITPH